MTDRDHVGGEWGLPSRDGSAVAADTVDPRDVLERVDSLTIYAWEAPGDAETHGTQMGPAAEDVADRFGADDRVTAGDVDGVCLAAVQGLRGLVAEQRSRIEAQAATIRAQRDDIESLRERLETLQATVAGREASDQQERGRSEWGGEDNRDGRRQGASDDGRSNRTHDSSDGD